MRFCGRVLDGIRDSAEGTAQSRSVGLDGAGDALALEGLWAPWIRGGWAYGAKFPSGPEITAAEESSDGVATRAHDTSGAYRVNLETGESQCLGNHDRRPPIDPRRLIKSL